MTSNLDMRSATLFNITHSLETPNLLTKFGYFTASAGIFIENYRTELSWLELFDTLSFY